MLKNLIAIILLSILILLAASYAQQGINLLVSLHQWIIGLMSNIFTGSEAGTLAKKLIALLAIPFITALIPVILYWAMKRKGFSFFMPIVWVVWLIQTTALVVLVKL